VPREPRLASAGAFSRRALEDRHRLGEVLQPMLAEVGHAAVRQRPRRRRQQPHSDPERAGLECRGGRGRRSGCCPRIGENVEERITLRVDLVATPAAKTARSTRRCSPSASAYDSAPSSCSSRVEPSTSVNKKVTVALGSLRLIPG
jgi:hypothetical protein